MVGDGVSEQRVDPELEVDAALEAELTVALELDSMEVEPSTDVLGVDSVLGLDPTVCLGASDVALELDAVLEREGPIMNLVTDEDIWGGGSLVDGLTHADLFNNVVDEDCIFYDEFSSIPDFSCMSSSSSIASNLAPAKPFVGSPSSAASAAATAAAVAAAPWGFENDENLVHADPFNLDPMETGDGLLVGDGFGCMDSNEVWDPSSIFQNYEEEVVAGDQNPIPVQNPNEAALALAPAPPAAAAPAAAGYAIARNESEELTAMFMEWMISNREYIRDGDMQNIKFRESTIESASRKLGNSLEGKKQLLRLILDWVQKNKFQKRKPLPLADQIVDGGGSGTPVVGPCFNPSLTWFPPPPQQIQVHRPYPGMPGYIVPPPNMINPHNYPMSGNLPGALGNSQQYPFPPQYFDDTVNIMEKTMKPDASATKEARKKRMARQRKNHSHRTRRNRQNLNKISEQSGRMLQTYINWADCFPPPPPPPPPPGSVLPVMPPAGEMIIQKSERNLKLILQKVLKQSDVGTLGRIVLPKREAETHLPELEARDGIPLSMEDIGTSLIWNLRFRFWPNNKSRMYLLENTGDFVRVNDLKEGDFIVLYIDVKTGKYLIRGVKVREGEKKAKVNSKKKPAKGPKNKRKGSG